MFSYDRPEELDMVRVHRRWREIKHERVPVQLNQVPQGALRRIIDFARKCLRQCEPDHDGVTDGRVDSDKRL